MADFCLIGKKLGHSLSPEIHNLFGYEYDLVELQENEIENFVKNSSYRGFNVTIPYKKTVMPFLDDISERAKAIGAVNTVVRRDGKLFGDNTDVLGMEYALKYAKIELKDKKVMILGTGGTSLTAEYLARVKGAREIVVVSRQGEVNYSNYTLHHDSEVIINTTPVGMYPNVDGSLVDLDKFDNLSGGFDAIYNPLNTDFILGLEKRKVPYSNGLRMLVSQAKFARDFFFGNSINDNVIEEIYNKLLNRFVNYTLIGMPGCGKSTIGKEIAKLLQKEFVDVDDEIVKVAGKTIPEIFEQEGEKSFRQRESEVIKTVTKERNRVISFGGGAVLNPENVISAKRNGKVVYIKRNLDELATDGRPLSKSADEIKRLFEIRSPLYEKYADIVVENVGSIDEVAKKIMEKIYEDTCD